MTDLEFANTNLVNKADRVFGYFVPPRTGNYRFYVSVDDQAQVYLNKVPRDTDPSNAVLVASCIGAVGFRNYFSRSVTT